MFEPTINIKKLNEDAVIPTRGSEYAAGYDLYASIDEGCCIGIPPKQMCLIGTGIAMEIPNGYGGFIYARSGLASKRGLRPANCVGVVDPDYRGEIKVALYNDSDEEQAIFANDRIAQIVFGPYLPAKFNVVDELDETVRGIGGFGSTDISYDTNYEQATFF